MSFFAEDGGRRLVADGAMDREPPFKRQRNFLLAELTYGAGTPSVFGRAGTDLSISSLGIHHHELSSFSSGPVRPLPGGDSFLSMVAAPASFSAASFIERHLLPSQPLPPTDLGVSNNTQKNEFAGIQLPGLTVLAQSRSKTRLCKHFIEGKCKFKESCNFAHSIGELKKMPGDGDQEGKALLEMYRPKGGAEKQSLDAQTQPLAMPKPLAANQQIHGHASGVSLATFSISAECKKKLCKYFILGKSKFNKNCNFAHDLNLRADGDETGKPLSRSEDTQVCEPLKNVCGPASAQSENCSVETKKVVDITIPGEKTGKLLKTKICKYFLVGACKYKELCSFAHGEVNADVTMSTSAGKDTHLADEGGTDIAAKAVESKDISQALRKTKACKFFPKGACRFGEACTFLHDSEQAIAVNGSGLPQSEVSGDLKPTYKTRLCNMWEKGEPCTFGAKCHFAHGLEEIRPRPAQGNVFSSAVTNALAVEAMVQNRQVDIPNSIPCSYDVSGTNLRLFRTSMEGWSGLGAGLGSSRGLNSNRGLLEQDLLQSLWLRLMQPLVGKDLLWVGKFHLTLGLLHRGLGPGQT